MVVSARVADPQVQLGDGIEGLLSLAPGSAALVLSDLPLGATRAKFDMRADLERLWPVVLMGG